MMYIDEFKDLLEDEGRDTPIYKIMDNKIDELKPYLEMVNCKCSYKNEGLDCCSGQYLDVTISINDLYQYMSENELLRFNNISSEYYNSDDYNLNPLFTNFEYWAKYGKINISKNVVDKIKEKFIITTQMILFDIENNNYPLPHFIKDYKHLDKPAHLQVDISNEGSYNILKNESKVYEDTIYNHKVYYKFCNIPYSYYSTHIIQPCSLHYNYTLERFISSLKESPEIENQIINISKEGLHVPLTLKINKSGVITKPVNCNTRLITSLYLKLPYIPCILMYDGTNDITNYLPNYPVNNVYCEDFIKKNHNDLYQRIINGNI